MASVLPRTASAQSLTCARCGAAFDCDPGGDCWCFAEPVRMPLPADAAAQCLCPDCLRGARLPQAVAD